MHKLVILAVLVFCVYSQEKPKDPIWPDVWQMEFHQDLYLPLIGTHHTKGMYSYNYTAGKYAIYREDGHYDRYCGLNGWKVFSSNKCIQYVEDGERYLYYPDDDECCYCCSASNGCGILKPDWMTGAIYDDEEPYQSVYGSGDAFKWDQKGLQDNFYYETANDDPKNRVMLEINQVPDDIQYFDASTFKTEFDPKVLQLPSSCSKKKTCSWLSTCSAVGRD